MGSKIITSAAELPKTHVYVLANDKHLSGWGEAEGKTNTCIFPCEDFGEAAVVMRNLQHHASMVRIRTVTFRKPRLSSSVVYSLFNSEANAIFYTPNAINHK